MVKLYKICIYCSSIICFHKLRDGHASDDTHFLNLFSFEYFPWLIFLTIFKSGKWLIHSMLMVVFESRGWETIHNFWVHRLSLSPPYSDIIRADELSKEEPLYEIKTYHVLFSREADSIWAELLASLKSFHSTENRQVYCAYHNYILHDFLQLKSLLKLASYSSREI